MKEKKSTNRRIKKKKTLATIRSYNAAWHYSYFQKKSREKKRKEKRQSGSINQNSNVEALHLFI